MKTANNTVVKRVSVLSVLTIAGLVSNVQNLTEGKRKAIASILSNAWVAFKINSDNAGSYTPDYKAAKLSEAQMSREQIEFIQELVEAGILRLTLAPKVGAFASEGFKHYRLTPAARLAAQQQINLA